MIVLDHHADRSGGPGNVAGGHLDRDGLGARCARGGQAEAGARGPVNWLAVHHPLIGGRRVSRETAG